MKRVEIFKVGTHRAMDGTEATYGERELRVAAAAYDPCVYKAPIVIGHPEVDAPAYGWVEALEFAAGTLGAWVDQVEPTFAEAVAEGRYRNVSASFWRPDAPQSPKPGVLYLRHVGFLGAAAPAVKGLKVASFAGEGLGTVCFVGQGGEGAVREAPAPPGSVEDMQTREDRLARAEVHLFCEGLIREGRLVPALAGMTETLLLAAPKEGVVNFTDADGGEASGQREALMRFLRLLPRVVHYGEVAPFEMHSAPASKEFVLPPGYEADPARATLMARAELLMGQHGLSFADAVRRAGAEAAR